MSILKTSVFEIQTRDGLQMPFVYVNELFIAPGNFCQSPLEEKHRILFPCASKNSTPNPPLVPSRQARPIIVVFIRAVLMCDRTEESAMMLIVEDLLRMSQAQFSPQ